MIYTADDLAELELFRRAIEERRWEAAQKEKIREDHIKRKEAALKREAERQKKAQEDERRIEVARRLEKAKKRRKEQEEQQKRDEEAAARRKKEEKEEKQAERQKLLDHMKKKQLALRKQQKKEKEEAMQKVMEWQDQIRKNKQALDERLQRQREEGQVKRQTSEEEPDSPSRSSKAASISPSSKQTKKGAAYGRGAHMNHTEYKTPKASPANSTSSNEDKRSPKYQSASSAFAPTITISPEEPSKPSLVPSNSITITTGSSFDQEPSSPPSGSPVTSSHPPSSDMFWEQPPTSSPQETPVSQSVPLETNLADDSASHAPATLINPTPSPAENVVKNHEISPGVEMQDPVPDSSAVSAGDKWDHQDEGFGGGKDKAGKPSAEEAFDVYDDGDYDFDFDDGDEGVGLDLLEEDAGSARAGRENMRSRNADAVNRIRVGISFLLFPTYIRFVKCLETSV